MHEGELEGGRTGWLGRLHGRSRLPRRGSVGLIDDLLDALLDAGGAQHAAQAKPPGAARTCAGTPRSAPAQHEMQHDKEKTTGTG